LQDQFGDYTISSYPEETQHKQLTAYGRPSLHCRTTPNTGAMHGA